MDPFNITIEIEGKPEQLYVVSGDEPRQFKIFDKNTYIGMIWSEDSAGEICWCAEGAMVKELAGTIGAQIAAQLQ